jgi:DNA polymerase-4
VVLRFRFGDYTRATRSHTLCHPTAQTRVVLAAAHSLLANAQPLIERRGLTLIGLTIANLHDDLPLQLCLPFDTDSGELLDAALDEIRTRYGPTAITRGLLLGRRPAQDMPLLPD